MEVKESFDIVLETIGIGAAVGYPWQAEVTIGGKSTVKCLYTVIGNLVKSTQHNFTIHTVIKYVTILLEYSSLV